jgi:hypothetical protein
MTDILTAFTDSSYFYFLIVIGIFAIGDFLGIFTKAKVSSVFVALFLFLVGFLTKILPANIIELAGLAQFGQMAGGILVFHMGTMINLKQLAREWRTVITALLSMVVVMIACFALAPILGMKSVIVAIPVINGGIVSTQIMSEAATELGLVIPAALGVVLYAIKKFAGSYPASLFGVREAKEILAEHRKNKSTVTEEAQKDENPLAVKLGFAEKYNKYFTDFTCLAISVLFAWLANGLNAITPINYSIWALLFGAILGYTKLVPNRILEKGKASGILSMLVFAVIVPSLAKISLQDLGKLGFATLLLIAACLFALFIAFYLLPGHKISQSKNLAMGIAMGQFLGFPATYLISNEIAKAVTDDESEQQIVLDRIMPAYVVAGLSTVTTFSIVIAGIFVKFL